MIQHYFYTEISILYVVSLQNLLKTLTECLKVEFVIAEVHEDPGRQRTWQRLLCDQLAFSVVSQTIQCVQNGKFSGNIHIQAKVIRDLYSLFDVDCIASDRTYTHLFGKNAMKPPDDDDTREMDLEDVGDCRIKNYRENSIQLTDDRETIIICDYDGEDDDYC